MTPANREQCSRLRQRADTVIDVFAAYNAAVTHGALQRPDNPRKLPKLRVCFSARYLKTARPDTEMFHHESCNPIYFWSKGQDYDLQKHCRCGSLHSCECRLFLVTLT